MGIGGDHQTVRKVLLAALEPGAPCPRCGRPMLPGQQLDLDHLIARVIGHGQGPRAMAHAYCNRQAGGRLGNARRNRNKRRLMPGLTAIGVEVYADRSHTAIVVATISETGAADIDLQPVLDGTNAAAAVARLVTVVSAVVVAVDPKSNAATLIEPLRAAGVPLVAPDAAGMALAHGQFSDWLRDGRIRHRNQAVLTAAVKFAQSRRLAGAAALQRYADTAADPAPAVAAELACWALATYKPTPTPFVLFGR
jgi:hypothetical protein